MPPKSKKRRAGKGFDTHKPDHEKKVKQEIGTYEVLDELDGVELEVKEVDGRRSYVGVWEEGGAYHWRGKFCGIPDRSTCKYPDAHKAAKARAERKAAGLKDLSPVPRLRSAKCRPANSAARSAAPASAPTAARR